MVFEFFSLYDQSLDINLFENTVGYESRYSFTDKQ
jgi:hypothetical protein